MAGYCKVPEPVQTLESRNIHLRTTNDKVDIGFMVHERVHNEYGFEVVTRYDTTVVLKVLCSALSGDHHSWNQKEYIRRKYPKHLSFLEYKRASGH